MRIALLGPLDHFGGGPRIILELYKVYIKTHKVDIITDFYDEEKTYSEFKGIPIKLLNYRFRNVPLLRRFTVAKKWLSLNLSNYDFAISTHPYSHLAAMNNKNVLVYIVSLRTLFHSYRWSNYPGALKFLDYALNMLFKFKEKQAVRKASCVATLSAYCREKTKRYYGVTAEIVPLGVNLSEFCSEKTEDYCLYVGRLSPEKRIDVIIRAWDYVRGNIKLCIVGDGRIAYIDYLKMLAKNKNIEFLGHLEGEKLKRIYARCLCTVYVPIEEDFGMVPLESMASGKPVIVSNEGGLVEIVRDTIDGFVIDPAPKLIAEKVNFLNENRKVAEEMGKRGLERAKEYQWEIIAEKLLNLAKERILCR